VLRIGSEAIPFLAEKDLPAHLRESAAEHDDLRRSGELTHPTPANTSSSSSSTAPANSSSSSSNAAPSSARPVRNALAPRHAISVPVLTKDDHLGFYFEQDEAVIKQLMDLGYARPAVIRALEMCNGNADLAASFLLQNSM
jgi:hypothetical protein